MKHSQIRLVSYLPQPHPPHLDEGHNLKYVTEKGIRDCFSRNELPGIVQRMNSVKFIEKAKFFMCLIKHRLWRHGVEVWSHAFLTSASH
jgi:hypothetical protein